MGNSVGGVGAGLAEAADRATDEELAILFQQFKPALIERLSGALEKSKPTWTIDVPPAGGILLCGHPISGNVQGIMMFCLKHVGADKYKFQECDIMKREQHNPDYYAMNPFHQVPAAKMSDGTCLYESCAMLRYLAKKFAPATYPADKALLIDMAMDLRNTTFYELWSPIGYHAMGFAPAPPKDASKKLNLHLAITESKFLTGKYIGGDSLCIADFAMLPLVNLLSLPKAKNMGYKLPSRWATYLSDAKAELGDAFILATQALNMRSASKTVVPTDFEPDEPVPVPVGDWKITETVPDGGILVCGHPASPNVIPLMCFCTKFMTDDKFKFQMCDILKGEQMSADFIAMNPFHQVPAGKMSDGTTLFESGSMLRYLALKYAPELYPADKQLVIDMAMDKRSTDLMKEWKKIGLYAFGLAPPPEKDAAKCINAVLGKMEKAFLTGTKYIGSDKITIADLSLISLINMLNYPIMKKMGYTLPARWTKYLADTRAELGAEIIANTGVQEEFCNSRVDQVTAIDFES